MVKAFFLLAAAIIPALVIAQKQTFDVVSYTAPKGWQQQQNVGGLQLSVADQKTGAYAMVVITKATASGASANENFNNDWNRLVKSTVQANSEPAMEAPTKQNDWDVVSGSATYTDGANTGRATLLTATGGSQAFSVILMTNTQQYQKELLAFINSLTLSKPLQAPAADQTVANNAGGSSVVGLWVYYNVESNGFYNGLPVPTGGYSRKEYLFNANGTYVYRQKNWMLYVKDILFVYETGTWAASGNKLTLTPKRGKGGWWTKTSRTSEWGPLNKMSEWKLEPTSYTFGFHYYSGSKENCLVLTSGKETAREGKQENNTLIYNQRALDKSLIDNPPGFKTVF